MTACIIMVKKHGFYDEYYDNLRELDGYVFDQMGRVIILKSHDGKVTFDMSVENLARRYERILIRHQWN